MFWHYVTYITCLDAAVTDPGPSLSPSAHGGLRGGAQRGLRVFWGGVPQHILYDNLPTAVVRVRGRDRDLTDRFTQLAAHYVFEPRFATSAAGWEKGLVEHLVGYAEQNYFTPVPDVPGWAALNATLQDLTLAERTRVLPRREGQSVGTLWDAERPALLPLPPQPFRAATTTTGRVTNRAWVTHRRAYYSVPVRWVGQRVRIDAYWDHLEIWAGTECLARHPLGGPGSLHLVLDHYLDVLREKPGAVRNARVVRQLPPVFQRYLVNDRMFRRIGEKRAFQHRHALSDQPVVPVGKKRGQRRYAKCDPGLPRDIADARSHAHMPRLDGPHSQGGNGRVHHAVSNPC